MIKRIVLRAVEQLEIETASLGSPIADEVRVMVEGCGICGSDLHMFRGRHPVLKPPLVMGHEFAGWVTEVGPLVETLAGGDRVVAMAAHGCGACPRCEGGDWNQCANLNVIGGDYAGGLSEEVVLPAQQFVRIPPSLPLEQAVLIEVAAVAFHAARRYGSVQGKSCLVLGGGPVGLTLTRVLKALGASSMTVSDISSIRRRLARDCGADTVVDLNEPGVEEHLTAGHPGGIDVAFDCAGQETTLRQALRLTRRGGSVLLVAIFEKECTLPMVLVQRAERQLIGVQLYSRSDFEAVIAMVDQGELDLSGIVTHTYPMENVNDAFKLLLESDSAAGKVLIRTGKQ